MGIFHKLVVGFKRALSGKSIDYVSEWKAYGNFAESTFSDALRKRLPNAIIKNNVMVETPNGRCEIDTLLKYQNKLFIIEVKHWKGVLTEQDGYFISEKRDEYTDEIHEKELKSPFNQIRRQVYLLKEMTGANPWINAIVFFLGADEVNANDEDAWFTDFDELIDYIINDGETSYPDQIRKCLSKCKESDYIYASSFKELHCIIEPSSLSFTYENKKITKDMIKRIEITHHFSYDDLSIELRSGEIISIKEENGYIRVFESGMYRTYSFSKINLIVIGD